MAASGAHGIVAERHTITTLVAGRGPDRITADFYPVGSGFDARRSTPPSGGINTQRKVVMRKVIFGNKRRKVFAALATLLLAGVTAVAFYALTGEGTFVTEGENTQTITLSATKMTPEQHLIPGTGGVVFNVYAEVNEGEAFVHNVEVSSITTSTPECNPAWFTAKMYFQTNEPEGWPNEYTTVGPENVKLMKEEKTQLPNGGILYFTDEPVNQNACIGATIEVHLRTS